MDKKSRFRKEALELLRDYNLPFRLKKELNYYLYKYIKQKGYKKVMLYIPLKSEVDINWLIKRLRMEKVEIFVPFMEGESFKLVKYKLPLIKKRFGIKEPKSSKVYKRVDINLALIPIIGIDSKCKRIGFGKGMYDRFFAKYKGDIEKIFISKILCYFSGTISNHYDIRGDSIVSAKFKIFLP